MAEKLFDHNVVGSSFQQPRCEGMSQVMEVQIMHPCPIQSFDPSVFKRVRIFPPSKEASTDPWQIIL
jgi:hypothetical protein